MIYGLEGLKGLDELKGFQRQSPKSVDLNISFDVERHSVIMVYGLKGLKGLYELKGFQR